MQQSEIDKIDESVRFVSKHYREGMFDNTKGWKKVTAALPGFRKVRPLIPLTRIAAAVLLLLVVCIGLWRMVNQPEQLFAETNNTELTLPDQTQIIMQKGAKLEYDKNFDKTERRVSMSGEITFAVVRDGSKPFIVSTPTAQVEVLGTEFTVTADDEESQLSVASGKVLFTPNDPVIPLLCTAGMKVHYIAETETVNVTSPGKEMKINGKTGSLSLDNMELKEVVRVLSHFYKTTIELPENESGLTFSYSFSQGNIIEIINIINITLDTHITIRQPQ